MASPGVKYLLNLLPKLLLPTLFVRYLCGLMQDPLPLFRYSAVRTVLYLCAGPLYLYVRFLWTRALAARRARKLGATFFPVHQGKWPAGVDFVLDNARTMDSEYIGDRLLALTEEHGPTFVLSVMGEEAIFTTEPHYIKQILATNFPNYVKGKERFGDATSSVLGSGVFNSDGDMWKFHRTMARPFFTRERVREFDIFARHADEVIQKMKDSFNNGTPVDMQDVMARFTLDSASEFLFGSCVNSILEPFATPGERVPSAESSDTHPTPIAFIRAFTNAQSIIIRRTRLGSVWKLWEIRRDESHKFVVDIDRFLYPITEAALSRRRDMTEPLAGSKLSGEIENDMTFLDHVVTQTQDPKIIRDSLMNMLIAGRDTTASTLTFTVYMLSQHPTVLTRLRDDILRVVGPVKVPTYDDIRNLQYLRAVINETLRLFPPVPLNMRDTINEDVWIGEDGKRYYIGPNMSTSYSVLLMHRNPAYWGEDALEFDPDRWIDDRLHKLTENPFAFLPFNAGPRICLGQQFAYNEVSFMIIRLLQSFSSVELRPDAQPKGSLPSPDWLPRGRNLVEKIWPRSHLTLYVAGGLWLTMAETSVTGDA